MPPPKRKESTLEMGGWISTYNIQQLLLCSLSILIEKNKNKNKKQQQTNKIMKIVQGYHHRSYDDWKCNASFTCVQ